MRWVAVSALALAAFALVGCGPSEEANADVQKPGTVEIVDAKPGMKSPEERGAAGRDANRKPDEGEGN